MSKEAGIASFVDSAVAVVTNDGRLFVGTLKGYDQLTNLILHDCQERICNGSKGMEQQMLGLQIVRGDNIAVVGEVDEEKDAEIDWALVQALPLNPIQH